MPKYKVFISSVQSEFSQERQLIFDFIRNDELMGQYFEPFIFEQIAAQDKNPRQLYLDEASSCQVYLLLIGKKYGNILPDGANSRIVSFPIHPFWFLWSNNHCMNILNTKALYKH